MRVTGPFLSVTGFKHQYTFPHHVGTHGWESLRDNTAKLRDLPPPALIPQTTPNSLFSITASVVATHFQSLTEEQLFCLPSECFTTLLHHLTPNALLRLNFQLPILRERFHAVAFVLTSELYFEAFEWKQCFHVRRDLLERTESHPDISVEVLILDETFGCEEHWLNGPYRCQITCGKETELMNDEQTLWPFRYEYSEDDENQSEITDPPGPIRDYYEEEREWNCTFSKCNNETNFFFPRSKEWIRFGYDPTTICLPKTSTDSLFFLEATKSLRRISFKEWTLKCLPRSHSLLSSPLRLQWRSGMPNGMVRNHKQQYLNKRWFITHQQDSFEAKRGNPFSPFPISSIVCSIESHQSGKQ